MQTNIIAALRVKNEARWIAEVLQSVSWCNGIYLFDDHSTDETAKIAESCGAIIVRSPFVGLDEARDKEWLSSHIASRNPEGSWILMIDGDEVVAPGGEAIIRASISSSPSASAFALRILYLWNQRDHARVDGVYGKFTRPSLFKLGKCLNFRRTEQNGHLHCSSVPAEYIGKCQPCPATLLHLGYMEQVDRIRKWKYYNAIDPTNKVEGFDPSRPERGSYPHIVQGDIPEVPASARLLHAGPLEIREL